MPCKSSLLRQAFLFLCQKALLFICHLSSITVIFVKASLLWRTCVLLHNVFLSWLCLSVASFRSYFTEVAAATFRLGCNVKARSNTVGLFLQLGDLRAAHLKAFSVHLLNREAWRKVNCTLLRLATFQRQVLDINSPTSEVKCVGRNPSKAGSYCPSKRWGVTCGVTGDILCGLEHQGGPSSHCLSGVPHLPPSSGYLPSCLHWLRSVQFQICSWALPRICCGVHAIKCNG